MDELALTVAQLQIDSSLVVQPQACGLLTGFSRLASMRRSGLKAWFALLEADRNELGGWSVIVLLKKLFDVRNRLCSQPSQLDRDQSMKGERPNC